MLPEIKEFNFRFKQPIGYSSGPGALWTLIHINALYTSDGEIMYSSGTAWPSTEDKFSGGRLWQHCRTIQRCAQSVVDTGKLSTYRVTLLS